MSPVNPIGGVYVINLDRRADRLKEITEELERIDLPFKRFQAIERNPGILGCGLSHLAVLKEARSLGLENVLILEDDFTLLVDKKDFWRKIHEFFFTQSEFDVCMLAYGMQYSRTHTNLLVKVLEAQTASGYIVNKCFYDALINLYEDAMPLLEKTHHHWIYANDQVWKKLQPEANWFAFKDRIGKQRASYSDLAGKFVDYDA